MSFLGLERRMLVMVDVEEGKTSTGRGGRVRSWKTACSCLFLLFLIL